MSNTLLSVKQIKQDELSGLVIAITSGFVASYIDSASGDLQEQIDALDSYMTGVSGSFANLYGVVTGLGTVTGLRIPISSGVDTIHCSYGSPYLKQMSVGMLGTSGATDPFVSSMITSTSATGVVISLSAPTSSSNYYLNLLLQI